MNIHSGARLPTKRADEWSWAMRLWLFSVFLICLVPNGVTQQFGTGSPRGALTFQPAIITTLAGTGLSGYAGDEDRRPR